MMANEYSYGTLKQNLIDGISKEEFIKSKFLTVLAFSALSTVFIFVMSLILGLCFSSYTEPGIIFSDMEYLIAYFVKLVGFFAFCLFIGILIKRSAFALGFILIWYFIEFVVIYWIILRRFLSEQVTDNIVQFLPLTALSNLIVEPITRLSPVKTMQGQVGMATEKDYGVHFWPIVIVLVWTVIFVLMSYKLLKKRDL
jgi:ABC-type transport system involved in multi-copper enzyme maturation permease subunit